VHRRKCDTDEVLHLHTRVGDCEESIAKLLEANKAMTDHIHRLTDNMGRIAEVLEAWHNAKGFWVTVKVLSGMAKMAIPIMVFAGAVWVFVKTGTWSDRG